MAARGCPVVERVVRWYVAGWSLGMGAITAVWQYTEAAAPGQQYADPLWPCAFLATFPAFIAAAAALPCAGRDA